MIDRSEGIQVLFMDLAGRLNEKGRSMFAPVNHFNVGMELYVGCFRMDDPDRKLLLVRVTVSIAAGAVAQIENKDRGISAWVQPHHVLRRKQCDEKVKAPDGFLFECDLEMGHQGAHKSENFDVDTEAFRTLEW